MTETQQSIQSQRAALVAERTALEQTVAECDAIWEGRPIGGMVDPNDERISRAVDAMQQASDTRARIESIADRITALDKQIAFHQAAAEAPAAMRTAVKELEAVENECAALTIRRDKVAARLGALRETAEQDLALAQDGERAASLRYAAAVAEGDDKAVRAAMETLEKAQAALDTAKAKSVRQAPVVEALEAELGKLDAARVEAVERGDVARRAFAAALRAKCAAEWERAAEALAQAGARLNAAYALNGLQVPGMSRFSVPRLDTSRGDLNWDAVRHMAADVHLPEVDAALAKMLAGRFGRA